MIEPNGHAMQFKPSLWQRIAWWRRWPWRPVMVHPDDRRWDARWVTVVRQNGTRIGHHLDEKRPAGAFVEADRWSCLYGLVTGRLRFDIEIGRGEKRPPVLECRSCRRGLIAGFEHDYSLDRPGAPRTCDRPEPNEWQLEHEGAQPLAAPQR